MAPDIVLVLLGVNGTCIQRDDTIAEHCEKVQVASMRELVRKLRAVAPVAKIAIGTCIVGTDQDAFGKNYGCMISAVQSRKDMLYLNRRWMALVKEFNDSGDANVFIVPVGQALDPAHGFPKHSVPRSASSTTMVERSSNAFHPTLDGGKQLGDAFAAWILCNL
jgi:lysophospholipase L1-like esterase